MPAMFRFILKLATAPTWVLWLLALPIGGLLFFAFGYYLEGPEFGWLCVVAAAFGPPFLWLDERLDKKLRQGR